AESRHKELEDRIVALETRQRELAAILESAPNDSSSFPLHRELADVTDELEQANAEWEQLAGSLTATV
ncbi:MAG: hypothetical protein RIQ71_1538, partial [Verrucomicrobiota bacterium]